MIYCSRFFVVLKIEEQRRMQLSVSFHTDVGPAGVQGFGLGAPGPTESPFSASRPAWNSQRISELLSGATESLK